MKLTELSSTTSQLLKEKDLHQGQEVWFYRFNLFQWHSATSTIMWMFLWWVHIEEYQQRWSDL